MNWCIQRCISSSQIVDWTVWQTPAGMPSGSFGPTTSGRMDQWPAKVWKLIPTLLQHSLAVAFESIVWMFHVEICSVILTPTCSLKVCRHFPSPASLSKRDLKQNCLSSTSVSSVSTKDRLFAWELRRGSMIMIGTAASWRDCHIHQHSCLHSSQRAKLCV